MITTASPTLRYASVCSGIEAPSVAWHPLGWRPVFFSENEKFPSRVLAHHYPDVPNLGDMTRIDGASWRGRVDVLIGGTPCQAFSVAGRRESLADDRGNLSLTFCELAHAIDPLCVVWENVPGVLSVNDNAFGCFLAGLVGEPAGPFVSRTGTWPIAGLVVGPRRSAAWRVLDAQYFGLAQRRRRVFVVSFRTRDRLNPGAVLLEPESVRRHLATSRKTGQGITCTPEGITGACSSKWAKGTGGPAGAEHYNLIAHSLRGEGFDASEDGTGRGTPIVPVAYGIHSDALDRTGECASGSAGGRAGLGISVNVSPCLGAKRPNAVAYRTSGNSGVMAQGDITACLGTQTDPNETIVQTEYGVRRLMPVEAERLQGFPDGYTAIDGAADGPRYKALGNSMATTVIRWLGRRIEAVVAASPLPNTHADVAAGVPS